ncbi:hypothetical protein CAPTEDRAFT_189063 [Capitella teleta]|uniref:Uncharacterized protein n=1 Tax=Capitella teleta TaxID=283909 RepID=R7UUT6_CAPTE|nr:hypothetical protein CAPTEDRAFT_189063 [Capitella teleta]|eukprot:ELU07692.1 hypothetical protein CAPTEDRAFT_189063 [Capitella teleta]
MGLKKILKKAGLRLRFIRKKKDKLIKDHLAPQRTNDTLHQTIANSSAHTLGYDVTLGISTMTRVPDSDDETEVSFNSELNATVLDASLDASVFSDDGEVNVSKRSRSRREVEMAAIRRKDAELRRLYREQQLRRRLRALHDPSATPRTSRPTRSRSSARDAARSARYFMEYGLL